MVHRFLELIGLFVHYDASEENFQTLFKLVMQQVRPIVNALICTISSLL